MPRHRLIERSTLGREQKHLLTSAGVMLTGTPLGPNRLHSFKDRSGLQQHAFAAAEGPVIHSPVPVMRPVPKVMDVDFDQSGFPSPLDDTVLKWSPEEFREDREHVEFHT